MSEVVEYRCRCLEGGGNTCASAWKPDASALSSFFLHPPTRRSVVFRLAPCGCPRLIINWEERKKTEYLNELRLSPPPASLVFVGTEALLKGRPPPLPHFPAAAVMGARPLMNPDSQQKADWGSALSSPGVGLRSEEVQLRVSPAMCHSSRLRQQKNQRGVSSFIDYRKVFVFCCGEYGP